MRALLQYVRWAEVEVDGQVTGRIEEGLLVYVGVAADDTVEVARRLARKVAIVQTFGDIGAEPSDSPLRASRAVLAVPNVTLLARASKGHRPALAGTAPSEEARRIYEAFIKALASFGCEVAQGVFGADMCVRNVTAKPMNILIDVPATSR